MGFCLFNNIAIAARWAQRERGVERVAIVDWDVHHGNGTEEIFLDDPIGADDLAAPGRALPRAHRRARQRGGEAPTSTCRCPPAPATTATRTRSTRVVAPALRAFRARPAARRRGPGRVRDRPARAHVGHRPGVPRARRPRGRARGRGLRRPPRGDARGRLLAPAPAARQPRDPRGARGPRAELPSTTRSASTSRPALRDVERDAVAAAERAHLALMLHDAHGFWIAEAGSPEVLPALEGDATRRRRRGRRRLHGAVDRVARARGRARRARRRARGGPLRARAERAQRRLRVRHGPQPADAARDFGDAAAGRGRRRRARRSTRSAPGARPRASTPGTAAAASCVVSTAPAQDGVTGADAVDGATVLAQDAAAGARALRLAGVPRRRVRARRRDRAPRAARVRAARAAAGARRADLRGQPRDRHAAGARGRRGRDRGRAACARRARCSPSTPPPARSRRCATG